MSTQRSLAFLAIIVFSSALSSVHSFSILSSPLSNGAPTRTVLHRLAEFQFTTNCKTRSQFHLTARCFPGMGNFHIVRPHQRFEVGEESKTARRGAVAGRLRMQLGDDAPDSTTSEKQVENELEVLRGCAASSKAARPDVAKATLALARVANAGVHPPAWVPALCDKGWRPVFSAKPEALKAAREVDAQQAANGVDEKLLNAAPANSASVGRFLTFNAEQRFAADGQVENTVRLLWGAVRLAFCGKYDMTGRRMSITFEELRVTLFGFLRFTLDIREGQGLRSFIERRLRGMRGSGKTKKKRPNVYIWCFADDGLCVAQGTSGSVAVWAKVTARRE